MMTTQSTGEEGLDDSDDDEDGGHPNDQAVYMPAPDVDMDIETGETDGLNKSCSLPMLSIQPTAFEVSITRYLLHKNIFFFTVEFFTFHFKFGSNQEISCSPKNLICSSRFH